MRNIISVAPAAGVAQASAGREGRPVEWPAAPGLHRLGLAFPGLALEAAYSLCPSAWELHVCGAHLRQPLFPRCPRAGGCREGKEGVYLAASTGELPPGRALRGFHWGEGCAAGEAAARHSQPGQAFALAVGVSRPWFGCEKE